MRKYFYFAMGTLFLVFAVIFASRAQDPQSGAPLKQFRPIGGAHNNLLHPEFDAVPGSAELAIAPLRFATPAVPDPMPGPDPRAVSNFIASSSGDDAHAAASPWLYAFGEFVGQDLSVEFAAPQGPPIAVKSARSHTAINTTAGYLDLSQLYGSTAEAAASLRARDGPLESLHDDLALQVVDGHFVPGDPRVAVHPETATVKTLFLREHNYWVAELKRLHPDWTGNDYYQMARAITTAEYQNIVYSEFLPVLIGPVLGPYLGYDPRVNAQVTQEFSTAAFRTDGKPGAADTIAIDIRRGRDLGLNTLNQTRKALGLAPYASFAELAAGKPLPARLQALYGSIDQVDLLVGGLAERPAEGALVGPTFREILRRQFHALRVGDRFFWANQDFGRELAERIAHTTLAEIIKRNTDTARVPADVFRAESGAAGPPGVPITMR